MRKLLSRSWGVGGATAALWLIWGSTYLAILWALRTLPPFLMAGARFVVAGAVLLTWAKWRGAPWPRAVEWRSALVIGAFLILVGNGGIVWAEQRLPTGFAALLVATVPMWMVTLEALRPGGARPGARVLLGIVLGLIGVGILVNRSRLTAGPPPDLYGVLACLSAALCWSIGSTYSRRAPLPKSPQITVAIQMLCGGVLLVLAGLLHGEASVLDLAAVSLRSWLAVGYLTVFGSLVGFSSYVYLLGHTTPARATTYAYVNPVVAVLLGWGLAGEAITSRMLLAMGVIVAAVILITSRPGGRRGRGAEQPVETRPAESAETAAFKVGLTEA